MKVNELAIIGAGIAGVTSAMYAARAGLSPLVFEPGLIGGQLHWMEDVDNYAGFPRGTKGKALAQALAATLDDLQIDVRQEKVTGVASQGDTLTLTTQGGNSFAAQALIVASGAAFKRLGLEGEERLRGKGVSYCAVCDGFFFRGKDVAVVGGGNTAVEEALYLTQFAGKVYLIHRRGELRAMRALQTELLNRKNIEVRYHTVVTSIEGTDVLQELRLQDTRDHKDSSLAVAGVFIAVGVEPYTGFLQGIVRTENGFILTDEEMKTSHDRIWACGDCRRRPLRQLITAASEGAIAALGAYRFLKGQYISA
jgi:thioredoxin reductase (NADPH)